MPFSYKVSEGGYEYFAKVPRGVSIFTYTKKKQNMAKCPLRAILPSGFAGFAAAALESSGTLGEVPIFDGDSKGGGTKILQRL